MSERRHEITMAAPSRRDDTAVGIGKSGQPSR
jgi:hypothetical protein